MTESLRKMVKMYNREKANEEMAMREKNLTEQRIAAHTAITLARIIKEAAWEQGLEVEVYIKNENFKSVDTDFNIIEEEISYKQIRLV